MFEHLRDALDSYTFHLLKGCSELVVRTVVVMRISKHFEKCSVTYHSGPVHWVRKVFSVLRFYISVQSDW